MDEAHAPQAESDDDVAIIRSRRCSSGPPAVGSHRQPCDICGAEVWISDVLRAEVAAKYRVVKARCIQCVGQEQILPHDLLPGQVAELHQAGLTDFEIVSTLALGMVMGGHDDLPMAMREIIEDPTGPLAHRFRDAFKQVELQILALQRRN